MSRPSTSLTMYSNIEDFVSCQLDLVNLERDAEVSESRKMHDSVPAKQLQEKGICLLNLTLQGIRSGLYGRTLVTFTNKMGKDLPATDLSSGKYKLVNFGVYISILY